MTCLGLKPSAVVAERGSDEAGEPGTRMSDGEGRKRTWLTRSGPSKDEDDHSERDEGVHDFAHGGRVTSGL